ncbi:barstar family protein [Nocardioides sp. SYSU D00038]|uniref:barstar family protein n=1 Tax=Nocardioides sp. SYSU D00038 TaxID=2812554 RepID=UPI0019672258|nr:barstar family protein [Nocardioides sp. SYSU D00038]
MSGLAALLAGRRPPGVYRWHASFEPAVVRDAVEAAGARLGHVDGWPLPDRAAVLAELGVALGFPDWHGRNLDALWDCLTDLTAPTVLLWDGWSVLARADEPAFAGVLGVLRDRSAEEPAFSTLLRGEGPDLADVPHLD